LFVSYFVVIIIIIVAVICTMELTLHYVCMLQLLFGTKVGSVRVFDIKEKKVIKDVVTDTTCPR